MRGVSVFVGFIAIVLAGAPATVLIGQRVREPADVTWTPVLVAVPVAVAGFLACRALRAAASRRYVEASIRNGRAGTSPAFAYTLIAWLLVGVAGGLAGATFAVSRTIEGPDPGAYRSGLTGYPLPVLCLFAALAVAGAAGYYSWTFRRRHEIPVLEANGVAVLVQPVRKLPKGQAARLRTRMWLQATVVDGLFFAGAVLPRLLSDDDRPTGEEIGDGVTMVVGGPGIVSFALLVVMLVLAPTRRSAFDALRQPSSLAAIGIFAVGWPLQSAGQELAAGICAFVAVLIASATCMNIMDRGAQPWLGFVFLAGNYVYGYLTAPDGDTVLPVGVAGWVVAVLAAAYALNDARGHWRRWTTLVHPADPAVPQP
ncbi:MAG: hypothetical protein GEV28_13320 [Actinophytocola sp.]|uniref:hypothetical protein n=1 Tax=Actinophytocola sp. TaxID=1872138 RepID=UPI00132B5F09|nr:hypothetical protein [Actinophytocola sp.]MPZ81319.1 hypothetical protein [Actinophytocola sp.]